MWKWCYKIYQKNRDSERHKALVKRSSTIISLNNKLEQSHDKESSELTIKYIEESSSLKFVLPNRKQSSRQFRNLKRLESDENDFRMSMQE